MLKFGDGTGFVEKHPKQTNKQTKKHTKIFVVTEILVNLDKHSFLKYFFITNGLGNTQKWNRQSVRTNVVGYILNRL